jgi:hypothetical protein
MCVTLEIRHIGAVRLGYSSTNSHHCQGINAYNGYFMPSTPNQCHFPHLTQEPRVDTVSTQ